MAISHLTRQNGEAVRAAVYLRQSLDKLGDELAISRQWDECVALCERKGWTPIKYEENNTSATKGTRPAYRQMLEDIEAGAVDAVVAWNLDRLHRQPIELEHFLALARSTGIAVSTCTGDVDLSTDDGRMFARMKGVIGIAEVERKTARQKLAMRQLANAGRLWWASRPFGYCATPDPITGGWWVVKHDAVAKTTIYNEIRLHDDEAPLVEAAYDAVLKGFSLHSIATAWNDAGVRTPKGNIWRGAQLRQLLLAERNAGLRQVPGDDEIAYIEGNWPPIVTEDMWRGVCGILADPKRLHGKSRARRYLMSGIAVCGRCTHPLTSGVTTGTARRKYECRQPGCYGVARDAERVDAMVIEHVVGRLSSPDAQELLLDRERDDLDQLQAEVDALRAQITAAEHEYDDGVIDGHRLQARKDRVNEKLAPIVATMQDAERVEVFEDVIGPDADEKFDRLDLDRKRAVIKALVTVTVKPSSSTRVFHRKDLDVVFRQPGGNS
jgi:DNA invertase Pin-like site-specific DNA recombinase